MAPAHSKGASSEGSASSKERGRKLKGALARGNALKKLKMNPEDTTIPLDTPLLPDNMDLTLGSLMASESLTYAQAIEVFLQFEHESKQAEGDGHEEHEELRLPPAVKKPKAKATARAPEEISSAEATKRKNETELTEKPTSKKNKSTKAEAAKEASTPSEKPASKKPKSTKAEAPEEASTPSEQPASKKPKSAKAEAPKEASTPSEKPTSKKPKSTKAEAPKEASTPSEKPASKTTKSTKAEAPAEPSGNTRNSTAAPSEHPEAEAEPEAPAPAETSKKLKKKKKAAARATAAAETSEGCGKEHRNGKKRAAEGKNATDPKIRKLAAKEDLASAEAEAKEDDALEGQLDHDIQEMLDTIDEPDEPAPGTPPKKRRHRQKRPATPSTTAPNGSSEAEAGDGKEEEPWSQDRQPDDPELLKTGWSCLSLELGEKQLDSRNPRADNASTIINDKASVTELIESLGASASQVSSDSKTHYGNLLALVGQLQMQLQKQQNQDKAPEKASVKPDAPDAGHGDGVALDEDQEEEAEAEEVLSAQSEASAEAEKKKTDAKEAALQRLRSTKNLPAPASSDAPSDATAPSNATAANNATAPNTAAHALPAPPDASTSVPEVNSKTHKKEYMRLGRLMNNGTITATTYPSMHSLANGTTKERAELLGRWVQSNENIAACECLVKATRRSNLRGQRVVQLVAVKDMSKAPYSFSERKIAHIIAHQQGVEDRDAPGIVEETKYWVTTAETRTDTLDISHEHSMSARANATADDMYNIMDGPVDPSLLARPKASAGPVPLSGDVLRAYDGFRAGLEKAAGVEASAPSGKGGGRSVAGSRRSQKSGNGRAMQKVPLNEETFRSDAEKHDRWSAELKKEISTISGLLLDLPDDDGLKEDLSKAQAKLIKLNQKFKVAATCETMDPLCGRIWDVVTELKILKGKAKGLISELKKRG